MELMFPFPLPWNLEFEPDPIDAAKIDVVYDPATGRLTVSLTNTSEQVLRPTEVRLVAEVEIGAAAGWAWLHGRYMQMDALVRNFGTAGDATYDGRFVKDLSEDGHRYVSREVVALTLPARASPTLLAGSLDMSRSFLDIQVDLDTEEEYVEQIALVFDIDGVEIAPGDSYECPPVLLIDGRDSLAMMDRYAQEVAAEMGARVPAHAPTGWCSWYYFYNRVAEADVLSNLDVMQREKHPAEYVQVDDGFQSHTGDWLIPNEKFPSGMGALARRIRDAGYRPGLWLAPFVLHEDSATLHDHPEFALKTAGGETLFVQSWLGRCAVLDCTQPAAEAWLREVIRTVVSDWGYEYLKLDALAFAAVSASLVRYHAPGTTAAMNLRCGLQIIREAAGDETFILGCTCHFGPAVGLVDAMRVGPDVKETWFDGTNPSVKHAMRMTIQRNWMHNRWWANDPDCLIVRDTDTALDARETRFLATAIALSGGMVVASDDLAKLSPARRDMALALFPPPGIAAEACDPSDGPVPSAWRADLGEGRFLVGILNWTDEPRWVVATEYLRPGEVAFDLWNGRVLGMGDVLLAPHDAVLWQVAGRGPTPRVVGDTGHFCYNGLFQRPVSGRIQVRNDLDRPRTIAIEARGRVVEAELAPGEMRWFD
jgi:alpha-galactosidase